VLCVFVATEISVMYRESHDVSATVTQSHPVGSNVRIISQQISCLSSTYCYVSGRLRSIEPMSENEKIPATGMTRRLTVRLSHVLYSA